jgi:hypothetical protein
MADIAALMVSHYLATNNKQEATEYLAAVVRNRAGDDDALRLIAALLDGSHPTHRLELAGGKPGKPTRPNHTQMMMEIWERIAELGEPRKRAYGEVAEKYGYQLSAVREAYRTIESIKEEESRLHAEMLEEMRNAKK